MKRFVLILRKVAKFVFRLISSRLSSRGAAGTINPEGLLANYSKRNLLAKYSKTPLNSAGLSSQPSGKKPSGYGLSPRRDGSLDTIHSFQKADLNK